jgi:thiol peroxidase
MQKRPNAVKFKDKMLTLVGPQLKKGDPAPSFACVNSALEIVDLSKTPAKPRMFLAVPSLDTPVCSLETKRFEEGVAGLKEKAACYVVSLDLPFAQKRYCTTENITNIQSLSDVHDQSFGQNYGVLIEGLPIPLFSRAVFVVDKGGKLAYCEYVPEVGQHPNYDAALEALKALAT